MAEICRLFFSFNKLVGGLHLAYFQYVQHPNATPLTAQNIKINFHSCKKMPWAWKHFFSCCPYNSIYFTWTETINSLRLYKHKIEHNTLGLSKDSVHPLPIFSFVHFPFRYTRLSVGKVCFPSKEKKIHVPDKHAPLAGLIRWIIQVALELADGFEYMKLQGNVHIWLDSGRV